MTTIDENVYYMKLTHLLYIYLYFETANNF